MFSEVVCARSVARKGQNRLFAQHEYEINQRAYLNLIKKAKSVMPSEWKTSSAKKRPKDFARRLLPQIDSTPSSKHPSSAAVLQRNAAASLLRIPPSGSSRSRKASAGNAAVQVSTAVEHYKACSTAHTLLGHGESLVEARLGTDEIESR